MSYQSERKTLKKNQGLQKLVEVFYVRFGINKKTMNKAKQSMANSFAPEFSSSIFATLPLIFFFSSLGNTVHLTRSSKSGFTEEAMFKYHSESFNSFLACNFAVQTHFKEFVKKIM